MHHDPNSSRGLIWYAVLVCWKFGFVLDLRLHDVQLEVPSRFHFAF